MSKRPDILYLIHRVPYPPNRGDRIRSFHLLEYLARRADVHLAALADEPVSRETRQALEARCRQVEIQPLGRGRWIRGASTLARGRSATEGLFASRRLRSVVRRWSQATRFDAAVAFCSSMAPYLTEPALRDAPAVVDLVDVDSQKWLDYAASTRGVRQKLYQLEASRLRRLEVEATRRARAVTLVSEAEAALWRRIFPNPHTFAVPNGVDTEYFHPAANEGRPGRCVFVGALDYRPNIEGICWFARAVWPRVREAIPSAALAVVGRNPDRKVRELKEIAGIDVVGAVPDVRPYLAEAAVAVAPLRIARGVQNKVLEAMASGRAVMASSPALEGLAAVPGRDLQVADAPEEWIQALTQLLTDSATRQRLATAGRRYVERHHAWDECLSRLDPLLGFGGASGLETASVQHTDESIRAECVLTSEAGLKR